MKYGIRAEGQIPFVPSARCISPSQRRAWTRRYIYKKAPQNLLIFGLRLGSKFARSLKVSETLSSSQSCILAPLHSSLALLHLHVAGEPFRLSGQ